ncbi:MAG: hypothetical protein ACI9U2_004344, partial [Bradymonadia bacterium]
PINARISGEIERVIGAPSPAVGAIIPNHPLQDRPDRGHDVVSHAPPVRPVVDLRQGHRDRLRQVRLLPFTDRPRLARDAQRVER